MHCLSFAQVGFVVGLAFDIVGAVVLARGLISKRPGELLMEGTSGYGSPPNVRYIANALAQKADAEVGVGILALGFFVQACDYLVFDQNGPPVLSAAAATVVAVIAAGTAVLVSVVLQRARVAHHRAEMIPHVLGRSSRDASWIRSVVRHLAPREAQRQGEADEAFVQRFVSRYAGTADPPAPPKAGGDA